MSTLLTVLRNVPLTTTAGTMGRKVWNWLSGTSTEAQMLEYVREHAARGDARSVLDAMEAFNERVSFVMDLGASKGAVFDGILRDAGASVYVELGGYLGYSAIRAAAVMGAGATVISLEANDRFAAIATELAELAGLGGVVQVRVGKAADTLPQLAGEYAGRVDVLLVDHWKDLYRSDVALADELGLLRRGGRVVADNILFPGAPEYREWMEGNARFRSELIEVPLGLGTIVDAMLVSELVE